MKQELVILVGNVASGKSTYCRKFPDNIIVNDDAIVTSLHGGNYKLYEERLKPLYKSIETHIIMSALSLGKTVIIDRPNQKRSTRQRYIGLAHSLDIPVTIVAMSIFEPEVHAKRRFKADGRGYSYEDWLRVAKRYKAEFDEIDPEIEEFDSFRVWSLMLGGTKDIRRD